MLKPSHVNVGATVALSSILLTGGYFSIFLVMYPFLALLDDADHHKGSVTQAMGFKLPMAKHRGYSHTLLFNIIVGSGIFFGFRYFYPQLAYIDLYVLIAISLSHLVADIFTVRGCPLLSPLTSHNFGIPLISTGTGAEKLFTFVTTGINIGLISTIAIRYIIPHQYAIGEYDSKLIMIAIGLLLFIVYLLFKEEVKNLKGDVMQVFSSVFRMIGSVVLNGIVAYALFYANNYFKWIDVVGMAGKAGIAGSTLMTIIGVIIFLPTIGIAFRQIDKMAFQFASAINIFIVTFLIGFFALRLF